jgi:hypothetical protein
MTGHVVQGIDIMQKSYNRRSLIAIIIKNIIQLLWRLILLTKIMGRYKMVICMTI